MINAITLKLCVFNKAEFVDVLGFYSRPLYTVTRKLTVLAYYDFVMHELGLHLIYGV